MTDSIKMTLGERFRKWRRRHQRLVVEPGTAIVFDHGQEILRFHSVDVEAYCRVHSTDDPWGSDTWFMANFDFDFGVVVLPHQVLVIPCDFGTDIGQPLYRYPGWGEGFDERPLIYQYSTYLPPRPWTLRDQLTQRNVFLKVDSRENFERYRQEWRLESGPHTLRDNFDTDGKA